MTPALLAAVRIIWWDALRSRVPVIVATVLAACTWATAAGIEPFTMVVTPPAVGLAGIATSVAAVLTSWAVTRWWERASTGLAVVAAAWLASSLQGLGGLPETLMAVALASPVLAQAGFALLLGPARRWILAVGLLAVLGFVLHVVGYQPLLDPGCWSPCADLSAPIAELLGARLALGVSLVPALSAAGLVVGLAVRSPRSTLVRAACVIGTVAYAIADVVPWWRWGRFTSTPVPNQLRTFAVMLVTAVIVVVVLREWRARRALVILARQLDTGSGIQLRGVQDVHFAVPGSRRWVDAGGREVNSDREEPGIVLTGSDGEPAVRLVATSWNSHDLVGVLSPALRLALDNLRLAVVARVRLAHLRASQARIVATADTERQRIERDLHDGAQQQLVGAAIHLASARRRLPDTDAEALEHVQALVHDALTGLRDISHGALLKVLGSEGLAAAVEDFIGSTNVDVELEIADLPRLAAPMERAAYDVVAAGLAAAEQAATSEPVSIRLARSGDFFTVTVHIAAHTPVTDQIADAADRVGATGGAFTVDNDGYSSRLEGTWPCAS
jgi:signal transduction histidine kinase